MHIRLKVVTLAVVVAGLAAGLSLWWGFSLQKDDAGTRAIQSAEREAAAIRQLAELQNAILLEQLTTHVAREQSARQAGLSPANEATLNKLFLESDFTALTLLKFDGKDHWQSVWTRERTTVTSRWPEGFLKSVVAELPVASARSGHATWFTSADPNRQPLFSLLTQVADGSEPLIAVGFTEASALQKVAEGFKGSALEVALIDERGFALAYSEQRYVGSSLQALPAVAELLKRREVLAANLTENRQRQTVAAGYALVGHSNTYVVAMIPLGSPWAFFVRMLLFGIGAALVASVVGIGMGFLNFLPLESALAYLSRLVQNVAQGNSASFPSEPNDLLAPLTPAIERLITKEDAGTPEYIKEATEQQVDLGKMGAYKEISMGLSQALRDPLASILGQAQLARAKAQSEDIKQHFVVVEREARRARDTIDHLLRLTGEEKFPRTRVDVQDVILASLASLKGSLSSNNIKVQKELAQNAPISVHPGQLQTALEEIIKNSVEAMDRSIDKNLRLVTSLGDGWLKLTIEDTGSGVKGEQLAKIFDPFFTSKSGEEHKGLGLTVAKGIIKGFGGRLRLESMGESGARAVIELPLMGSNRAAKSDAVATPIVTAPAAAPVPVNAPDILAAKPLSGTAVDKLPTAPAADEMTYTGIRIEDEKILSAAELPLPPAAKGEADPASGEPAGADGDVTIRRPKLRDPS